MNTSVLLRIAAFGVFVTILAAPSSAAASRDTTLRNQAIVAGKLEAVNLRIQHQAGSASQPQKKPTKLKAVLIGATIGAGIGAIYGVHYCHSDCGGGRPRGAEVFGLAGAGIGAVGGLVVGLIADR